MSIHDTTWQQDPPMRHMGLLACWKAARERFPKDSEAAQDEYRRLLEENGHRNTTPGGGGRRRA